MDDLSQVARHLVGQTRAGQRQFATAQVLTTAETPLDRAALMGRVEAAVGKGCYGARPEPTVWADIQALKQAGLPIRYRRAAPDPGYYVTTAAQEATATAARLLRRIGWQPGDLVQARVYARMAPARKVEQMLQIRGSQVRLLEDRLRADHPTATTDEIRHLRQARLALLTEEAARE